MSSKYYAHFVAENSGLSGPENTAVWSSCVLPCDRSASSRTPRRVLASNFDLPAEDIRILNWATLH